MSSQKPDEKCPACGEAVPDNARYCPACGVAVDAGGGIACPACREPNPQRARFCHSCGAPLSFDIEADRRVVTVLFADISGFTGLTEHADPEDVHQMVAGCLNRLSDCITRWGGYVDKFIGDCVMGIFGAPVAYENEAERAVRAALDMHDALRKVSPELATALGLPGDFQPHLRIGINTGPVVMGLFGAGGGRNYTAVGDTVNVASRLEGLCETGRVLVGAATFEQTEYLFDYDEIQVLQLRGRREPIRTRHVIGIKAKRGRARGFQGKRTALIGRNAELSILREQWGRVQDGEFRVCLITGPAGIGKSRLVEEIVDVDGIGDEQMALGRSYPYASNTPWEPLAELIRDFYRVPADRSASDAAERIAGVDAEAWPAEDLAGLKIVLGTPVSEVHELKGHGAADRRVRMSAAVLRALHGGDPAPRLLVLEDLHWADRTTLEFLSELPKAALRRSRLLLLVSRPPLPTEKLLAQMVESIRDRIDVVPLPPTETREFIDALLDEHEVPDDVFERIIDRAEGNPLFIEETLKSLTDSGALTLEDGTWRIEGDVKDLHVPDTIESVLTTRIDGLDSSAKRVLQLASIVGRRFWSGVLADALARRPVDRELGYLLEGAFVRALPFSAVGGNREFLFEHLLLQEVAYEGMLKGLRAELHSAVAEWLEHQLGGQAAEYGEWIAFHHERSNHPEKALPYLERAAQAAHGRGAIQDARSLVERGLELAADPDDQVRLLCIAEDIATEAGDEKRRRDAIGKLEELAARRDDDRAAAEAALRWARYLLDSGDIPAARTSGATALALFEKLDDISQQGDALRLLGRVSHLSGDYPSALRFYRASLPLERRAGDRHGQAEIFDRLGLVQVDLGSFTTALDHFEAARDICVELGDRLTEARVVSHQALALLWLGQVDAAEANGRVARELAIKCGSRRVESGAEWILGMVLAQRGATDEARSVLGEVVEQARNLEQPGLEARAWVALAGTQEGEEARESARRGQELGRAGSLAHCEILALTRRAELELAAGDIAAAEDASAEAIAMLDLRGNMQGPEEAVLYTRARVLKALGRQDESEEALQRARTIIMNRADRIEDAGMRECYVRHVPLNREILGAEAAT